MTDLLVSLAVLLPLGGAVVMVFFGKRLGEPWVGYLGTLTVVGAFGGAVVAAADFFAGTGEPVLVRWFDWFPAFGV
ncbi:MAG: NADH-quinone oxidoreductase subunit L, partial [Acidimicrobiia bacterium]|nr:NADH-quinone oxidoreductase subunit L [Acidimicrobiia bacterium]